MANALPMPLEPPVTNTRLPCKLLPDTPIVEDPLLAPASKENGPGRGDYDGGGGGGHGMMASELQLFNVTVAAETASGRNSFAPLRMLLLVKLQELGQCSRFKLWPNYERTNKRASETSKTKLTASAPDSTGVSFNGDGSISL